MTNEAQEDIAFETLQKKAQRDAQEIKILHGALEIAKQKKLRTTIISMAAVPIISFGLSSIFANNSDVDVNVAPTIPTEIQNDRQITHVTIYFKKDGEEENFTFSFNGDPDDLYSTKDYTISHNGLDSFYVRYYNFHESDPDKLSYDTYVKHDSGSLAKNTALRDEIVSEALKAGFLEKTGLTELPNVLRQETNNAEIAPGQRSDWTIDIDGIGQRYDALEIQYTNNTVARAEEHVNHNISLRNNTYCTDTHSRFSFGDIRQDNKETCQNLDTMGKKERSKLFSEFNAQKLFNVNTTGNSTKAIISEKTTNGKTIYNVSWHKKIAP